MSAYQKRHLRLKSFLGFAEFWYNVKTESAHGKEVNLGIINGTKRQLIKAERLAMSEQKSKHILVAVEKGYNHEGVFNSVIDRFASDNDMLMSPTEHRLLAEYSDSTGVPWTVYDEMPDTIDFILAFALTVEFADAVMQKAITNKLRVITVL